MKHEFQSFWYGGELSPYEVLCLKSFLDHGHGFKLYTYKEFEVPIGVQRCDANEVLPESTVFFYKHYPEVGSIAAFANQFRYALLSKFGGWWVDMDMICLADDIQAFETFYALEKPGRVNSAMLRFPAEHEAMIDCLKQAEALGHDVGFGVTGPTLCTSVFSKLDMLDRAQEPELCYPIKWSEYLRVFDPKSRTALEQLTKNSAAVHLWNELIRRGRFDKQKAPPQDSFLDVLSVRHGVTFSKGRYTFPQLQYLHKKHEVEQTLRKAIKSLLGR
ncbi:glycosyltransferase [soil metagenome]